MREIIGEEKTKLIAGLNAEKIPHVYSGKPGCCCGCNGNHRYNPMFIAEQSKRRGYAIDLDEVNMTQIRKVVRIIQEHSAQADAYENEQNERTHISYEIEGQRLYIVYLS